mmetsp:Transcript_104906/g.226281  ORF Transcript_104906/g.226281 Transcript_104906/m.226281 type:complete len:237 (-) Transcript_104906:717-1427(-)
MFWSPEHYEAYSDYAAVSSCTFTLTSAGVAPPASISSSSITLLTPSIIFCTSCTSEKPSLCLLDTSNLAPTAGECSPADPLGWRSKAEHTCSKSSLSSWLSPSRSLLKFSSFTITEARRPVPRLEGQVPKKPSFSVHMSLVPLASAEAFMASERAQKRVNTEGMSPPISMEMIRQWSSSLTQHRAVWASLWKMPLLLGQERAAPAPVRRFLAEGIWKRNPFWSKKSLCSSLRPPSS